MRAEIAVFVLNLSDKYFYERHPTMTGLILLLVRLVFRRYE